MLSRFANLVRDENGASVPEFGVLSAFLMMFVIASVDIGRMGYRSMQVKYAASAGTAYAVAHGFDATLIASAVTAATGSTAISATPTPQQWCGCPSTTGVATATCGSTCTSTSATAGVYATVSAQAPFSPYLRFGAFNYPSTLTSQIVVRIQ